jgi:hypothetical protein
VPISRGSSAASTTEGIASRTSGIEKLAFALAFGSRTPPRARVPRRCK